MKWRHLSCQPASWSSSVESGDPALQIIKRTQCLICHRKRRYENGSKAYLTSWSTRDKSRGTAPRVLKNWWRTLTSFANCGGVGRGVMRARASSSSCEVFVSSFVSSSITCEMSETLQGTVLRLDSAHQIGGSACVRALDFAPHGELQSKFREQVLAVGYLGRELCGWVDRVRRNQEVGPQESQEDPLLAEMHNRRRLGLQVFSKEQLY